MSESTSEWTIETIKQHFEQRFMDSDKAVGIALSAQKEAISVALVTAEKAVLKAENATEKRFESVNEFRSTLADQQRTLIPRSEVDLLIKSITDRLKILEDMKIQKGGELGGAKNLWAIIIGIAGFISIVTGLITFFLNRI